MSQNCGKFQNKQILGFNEDELERFINPEYTNKHNNADENSTYSEIESSECPPSDIAPERRNFIPQVRKVLQKDCKTEHFSKLGSYAQLLWSDNLITDITIKVNDYNFNAHRAVLACFSPVLKKKLAQVNSHTVQLSGVKPGILRILLNYMYTGELKTNCQTLHDVFCGAKQLEMKDVVTKCAEKLRGIDGDMDSFWYVYISSLKLGLCEKARKALERIALNFEECMRSQEFFHLTFEQLCSILRSDDIAVRSELVVFLAALKWLDYNHEVRDKHAIQVLECVRFPLMREVEILYCFNPPIAKHIAKNPNVRFMLLHALCYSASVRYGLEGFFKNFGCKSRTQMLQGEITELWDFDENEVCSRENFSVIGPEGSSLMGMRKNPFSLKTKDNSNFSN